MPGAEPACASPASFVRPQREDGDRSGSSDAEKNARPENFGHSMQDGRAAGMVNWSEQSGHSFEASLMPVTRRRTKRTRAERLLEVLEPYDEIVVLTHDNPDPDAIATGWALRTVIAECLDRTARLVAGGAIVRAENKEFMSRLQPPLELVSGLDFSQPTGVIFVDCGPLAVNHVPFGGLLQPLAVVDHHATSRVPGDVIPHFDVRPQAAASASIATAYLHDLSVEPSEPLATALLYAIRTETHAFETEHSALDRRAIRWLTKWANPSWIAEIENAPLTRSYFRDLTLALQNTLLYGDVAFCLLPCVEGAEVVGEVADLLVRCEDVKRVLCAAVLGGALLISVRTSEDDEDAGKLVQEVLDGLGHGGGHAHRAGGKIPPANCGPNLEAVERELRDRWARLFGRDSQHGVRLIARSDVLKNL